MYWRVSALQVDRQTFQQCVKTIGGNQVSGCVQVGVTLRGPCFGGCFKGKRDQGTFWGAPHLETSLQLIDQLLGIDEVPPSKRTIRSALRQLDPRRPN